MTRRFNHSRRHLILNRIRRRSKRLAGAGSGDAEAAAGLGGFGPSGSGRGGGSLGAAFARTSHGTGRAYSAASA